jgi:hypothetical protein
MIRLNNILFMFCTFLFFEGRSQISIDKSLELTGNTAVDRQISNLSDPIMLDQIISAKIVQENSNRFGIATGTDSLNLTLNMSSITDGSVIYFQATASNTSATRLSINNSPFIPLKLYSSELRPGQLKANQIYCAVFTGIEYQILSPLNAECRQGFIEINPGYCIEINERPAVDFWQAVITCNSNNARLCKWSEWYYACQKTASGLQNTTGNWEWTDDGADVKVRVAGSVNCTTLGVLAPTAINAYRCCYSK